MTSWLNSTDLQFRDKWALDAGTAGTIQLQNSTGGTFADGNVFIKGVARCTVDDHAANKEYVDSVAKGLDTKQSSTLATSRNDEQSVLLPNADNNDGALESSMYRLTHDTSLTLPDEDEYTAVHVPGAAWAYDAANGTLTSAEDAVLIIDQYAVVSYDTVNGLANVIRPVLFGPAGGTYTDSAGNVHAGIPVNNIVLGPSITIINNSDEGITGVGIRLLVKDQAVSEQNGIYKITTIGNNTASDFLDSTGAAIGDRSTILTRTLDADSNDELTNAFTFVMYGEIQAANGYTCTGLPDVAVGGGITWTQFSATGNIRVRDGIEKDNISNTLDADVDGNFAHAAGEQTIIIRDDVAGFVHNLHGGGRIGLKNDGTINLDVNEITLTTGEIDSDFPEVHIITGNNLQVDNGSIFVNAGGAAQLTLAPGSITDASGTISFGDEFLRSTGTISIGDAAAAPSVGQARFYNFHINGGGAGVTELRDNQGGTIRIGNENKLVVEGTTGGGGGDITIDTGKIHSSSMAIDFNNNDFNNIQSADIGALTIVTNTISNVAAPATGIDFQANALTNILSAQIANCTYLADTVATDQRHELNDDANLVVTRSDGTEFKVDFTQGTCHAMHFTATSDERLKKNIDEIDNAVEKLESIRGVKYNWIDEKMGTGDQMGFLAQEVEEVFPEMVNVGSDGMRSIDYSRMCTVLVQAVKEQQGEINILKQSISV